MFRPSVGRRANVAPIARRNAVIQAADNFFRFGGGQRCVARIGRTHFNPLDEVRDHVVRQLLRRRHLERLVTSRFDQRTRIGIAGNNGFARLASRKNAITAIETQFAFRFGADR